MTAIRAEVPVLDNAISAALDKGFLVVPVTACDDCPGRPDCRCADGHTDTTDCTCPPQGGDS